jgi:hypothetical protein
MVWRIQANGTRGLAFSKHLVATAVMHTHWGAAR